MNKIIVKSAGGLFWGLVGSFSSIYFANIHKTKIVLNRNYLKKKICFPLLFGGVTGFLFGFNYNPLISLYKKLK